MPKSKKEGNHSVILQIHPAMPNKFAKAICKKIIKLPQVLEVLCRFEEKLIFVTSLVKDEEEGNKLRATLNDINRMKFTIPGESPVRREGDVRKRIPAW